MPPEFDVPGCDPHPALRARPISPSPRWTGGSSPGSSSCRPSPPSTPSSSSRTASCATGFARPGQALEFLFSGLDEAAYLRVVGEAILGGLPPENVVLLDLDPPRQSTYPDFTATEKLFGVRSVCPDHDHEARPRALVRARRPDHPHPAHLQPPDRGRAGGDRSSSCPSTLTDPLDVQWAGHPNWFFRWSKHALPRLRHPLAARCPGCSRSRPCPGDLENWVLKPLFSFSGSGVQVEVTPEVVAAVPAARAREHAAHAQGRVRAGHRDHGRPTLAGRGAHPLRLARGAAPGR